MRKRAAYLDNNYWVWVDALSNKKDTELHRTAFICLGKTDTFNDELWNLDSAMIGQYRTSDKYVYVYFERIDISCGKFRLRNDLLKSSYPISEYIITNFNSLHEPFKNYLKDIIKEYALNIPIESILTYNRDLTTLVAIENLLNTNFIRDSLENLKLSYAEMIDKATKTQKNN